MRNIGKDPVHLSSHPAVHLPVHPHAFLHDGWMDFFHIGYHDQVPWAVDARKIEFGSVRNLTNYGHFFINFEFCDIPEKNVILFISGTVIRYIVLLMLAY